MNCNINATPATTVLQQNYYYYFRFLYNRLLFPQLLHNWLVGVEESAGLVEQDFSQPDFISIAQPTALSAKGFW